MHRFRKKSETSHSGQGFPTSPISDSDEKEASPQFPLPNDFRTSLILPDLSRRFSLLRSPTGEPLGLEVLKRRLADQRARGVPNSISEEEEDMIFDSLRSFRSRAAGSGQSSDENVNDTTESEDNRQSTSTVQSSVFSPSVSSSPSARSTKRYTNNLFGSGRFNDYNYMRSVMRNRTTSTTESTTTANGKTSPITTDSLRPVTPESTDPASLSSAQSSPKTDAENHHSNSNNTDSSVRTAPSVTAAPYSEPLVSVADYRLAKALGPSALKRASMAIEQVIREFEEEAEDEILMPRSTPVPRANAGVSHSPDPQPVRDSALSQSSIFEAIMAISSDKQVQSDPEVIDKRASPVPSRILPGYVPGMPRPMTPRDFDIEEQRPISTTPRATSPIGTNFPDSSVTPSKTNVLPVAGRLRSNSAASQSGSTRSPTSPLFLQRSPNSGRFTPEDAINNNNSRTEFESPLNSTLLARRRPASPLSNPPFQPMAVSPRPSTPSNVIWNTNVQTSFQSQKQGSAVAASHARNESWVSDGGSDVHNTLDRYTSGPRPVHSPPLPDSPIEGTNPNIPSFGSSYNLSGYTSENERSPVAASVSMGTGGDFGTPRQPPPRSPTPTQSAAMRSPVSPTFGGDSSTSSVGSTRPLATKLNSPSHTIPPLVFSPLINSSRISLESTGSSYHTREEGEERDRSLSLFTDLDTIQSAWHDLSPPSSATLGESQEDDWNPEQVLARLAGLKKSDLVVIQEKLVAARDAKEKEIKQEPQERAASSLRKRRPSTSQSNYSSIVREPQAVSTPHQVQTSPPKATHHKTDGLAAIDTNTPLSTSLHQGDLSPTSRRKRDLTRALFGQEDTETGQTLKIKPHEQTLAANTDQPQKLSPNLDTHSSTSTLSPPAAAAPYQLARNPSVPRIPQGSQEEAQLVQAVQEKINAATQLLKPPNGTHSPDLSASSRKRIDPSQISTPRLVAASTSVVDTFPIVKAPSIASATSSAPSKIGSRFKKLRGSLRAKNPPPNGDEITPYPIDLHSPPSSQMAHYDPAKLKVPGPAVVASATETRFKVPVPSPPASAGPGLKGFMARFRGKPRPAADTPAEPEYRKPPQQSPAFNPHSQPTTPVTAVLSTSEKARPQTAPVPQIGRKPVPASRPETPHTPSSPPNVPTHGDTSLNETIESTDQNALRQFFEAANKIGIDQGELNALLARSGSTSSKGDWSATVRGNPATRTGATSPTSDPSRGRVSIDDQRPTALTPEPKILDRGASRPSIDGRDKPVSRQGSRRQADHLRRPREGKTDNPNSTVVRKTIIVPDTVMSANELKSFMEKSLPGRRASVTSTSTRSIHDRAPTPPPPRSPTHKRFSTGPSPPVPSLPAAFGNSLSVPSASVGLEKSNSTYDSLYDMYAGESRSPSATPNESGPSRTLEDSAAESGAAVELIHLANGETIWNIVNGLREDDDEESIYTRRTSFASDYSSRAANGGSGIQVFVKEHGRSGSTGSTSSFLSRKRTQQGKQRPETKVFYSPAEGIGRLIQDLSQNMEAGSFNFTPRPGHSASSSLSTNDMTWSLEQRLDEMIDTVRV